MTNQNTIGILAYGSLISNPGDEIKTATTDIIENVETPFCVEFARESQKRGGAPTLVPVKTGGAWVKGQIFVVNLPEEEATDVLYRRELDQVGSGKRYVPKPTPTENTMVVERLENFAGLDVVLFTKLGATVDPLTVEHMARLAISSVGKAAAGRDGISYLMAAKKHGIVTALSPDYEREILRQTGCGSLESALEKAAQLS